MTKTQKLLLVIVLFLTYLPNSFGQTELRIDASTKYQTIDNFGASDAWSFQFVGNWYTPNKEKIAELLFSTDKGIGLSAWRFNIGAGKENNRIHHPWRSVETFEVDEGVYDWTRQSAETWFLHAAKERGVEQFVAFVNSPPARMTKSGYTNCNDGLGSTNLNYDYEEQFAEYLTDILKHFKDDEGIEFESISPVNEPQWEWNESNQEGNRASNSDIKNIVLALHDKLQEKGLSTAIDIVESGNIPDWYQQNGYMTEKYGKEYGNYLKMICDDPELNDKVNKKICGHSYWSDLINTELIQDRIAFKSKLTKYQNEGWRYWMTEYNPMEGPNNEGGNGRDLTMETALNVARVIHYDLTILNASAWQWWTAFSPEDYKDGLLYTNYFNPGDNQSIIESKLLWVMGNYSRFIRPGSSRIKCSGASNKTSYMASAYIDPNSNKLIIVYINVTDDPSDVVFSFEGFNNSSFIFTPYITTDENADDLKEYPSFDASGGYTVPARSVVTFVADNITSVSLDKNLPESPKLLNNYPNPFNPETKIEFTLPSNSFVTLEIYDSLGQKVDILISEHLNSGEHIISFNADNYSTGLYLARLSTSGFEQTIKMIYLK